FDDVKLAGRGVTALRQTLEAQGRNSLDNVVKFVSELRGLKFLMDKVSMRPDAEVVLVNATADEFLDWLAKDNLTEARGLGRLRSGLRVRDDQKSEGSIPPGLVLLTDIAFTGSSPAQWLERLAGEAMRHQGLGVVLPPFCLSTPPQSPAVD